MQVSLSPKFLKENNNIKAKVKENNRYSDNLDEKDLNKQNTKGINLNNIWI